MFASKCAFFPEILGAIGFFQHWGVYLGHLWLLRRGMEKKFMCLIMIVFSQLNEFNMYKIC